METGFIASPRQQLLIGQAATLVGKTFANFMLDSATARAEYMLINQSRLVLDELSVPTVLAAIHRPAAECPRLKALLDAAGTADQRPVVEKLELGLDLAGFDCGHPELNDWLLHSALPGQFMRCSYTYVARTGRSVAGYYALGVEALPAGRRTEVIDSMAMPQTISAMILLRLAVDLQHQKKGLGRALLRDAITRFARVGEKQKLDALFVQAKNEAVRHLYIACGFDPLPSEHFTLFLPRKDVVQELT